MHTAAGLADEPEWARIQTMARIRDKRDGQDLPRIAVDGPRVLDVRCQRLENRRCPDCPTRLRFNTRAHLWGWCPCCERACTRMPDGEFAMQEALAIEGRGCSHVRS